MKTAVCRFNRPLKRMTVGMVLAAIAFVCAALVQLQLDVSRHKHKFVVVELKKNSRIYLRNKILTRHLNFSCTELYRKHCQISHRPPKLSSSCSTWAATQWQ